MDDEAVFLSKRHLWNLSSVGPTLDLLIKEQSLLSFGCSFASWSEIVVEDSHDVSSQYPSETFVCMSSSDGLEVTVCGLASIDIQRLTVR